MNAPSLSATDAPLVRFLVCESGRRWCDAARRFVGPFQHAAGGASGAGNNTRGQVQMTVSPVEHAKVRASLTGHRSIAILWELTPENAGRIALTIAQIGVGRPDAFQLVAIDHPGSPVTDNLSLRIMELGVAAVVHTPEHFSTIAPLVRRRFADS